MPLIAAKNISFSYPSVMNGFALRDVSLDIDRREFISILGPNGSGKSTLLRLLSGVLKPGKGELYLDGQDYGSLSHKDIAKLIAFVPQNTHSIFPFSVYEIVMMGRTPHLNYLGYESREDHDIVQEALGRVGITDLMNKGINEVSGGEAQRAFLARALVQKPSIVLLDEPNAHLDIKHQLSFFNLLEKLNEEESLSVVFVSHDLSLSGQFGKRGILIKDGTIYMDDSKERVITTENIKHIFEVDSEIMTTGNNNFHVLINSN
jgi:iron complex transport system ATP-binding protein